MGIVYIIHDYILCNSLKFHMLLGAIVQSWNLARNNCIIWINNRYLLGNIIQSLQLGNERLYCLHQQLVLDEHVELCKEEMQYELDA
jgi:hypothetical protein